MTSPDSSAATHVPSIGGAPSHTAVATTRAELRAAMARPELGRCTRVAFVPTMGALHRGHAALLDEGRERGDLLIASIFVNPLQFGSTEDLSTYPRTLDADVALCDQHGVDVVFAPTADVVYPTWPPGVTVDPGRLGAALEGTSRPGHLQGVLTVVAKLFGLVSPQVAVFGQKDYQQLVLVNQLVADLCMPIEIVGAETVREPDGLALSSRNRHLSAAERLSAVALSRALLAGRAAGPNGPVAILSAAERVLASEPGIDVDYLALRGTDLSESPMSGQARLLVAGRIGATRLIDNVAVQVY